MVVPASALRGLRAFGVLGADALELLHRADRVTPGRALGSGAQTPPNGPRGLRMRGYQALVGLERLVAPIEPLVRDRDVVHPLGNRVAVGVQPQPALEARQPVLAILIVLRQHQQGSPQDEVRPEGGVALRVPPGR